MDDIHYKFITFFLSSYCFLGGGLRGCSRERNLLLVPNSSSEISVVQWPPFLLASKVMYKLGLVPHVHFSVQQTLCLTFLLFHIYQIPIALDMAKDFKENEDAGLFKKIKNDDYMHSAVIECYESLRDILYGLLEDQNDKM